MEKFIMENEQFVQISKDVKELLLLFQQASPVVSSLSSVFKKMKVTDSLLLNSYSTQQLLNISDRTLRRYRSTGQIDYVIIGNSAYHSAEQIEAFLMKQISEKNMKRHRHELDALNKLKSLQKDRNDFEHKCR